MKLIIAGGRNVTDPTIVGRAVFHFDLMPKTINEAVLFKVVVGGASGVDYLAEQWANDNKFGIVLFKADWDKYGKSAGPIRNGKMADYGDELLAIWDGVSRGTANMIAQMNKRGKPVYIYNVNS